MKPLGTITAHAVTGWVLLLYKRLRAHPSMEVGSPLVSHREAYRSKLPPRSDFSPKIRR